MDLELSSVDYSLHGDVLSYLSLSVGYFRCLGPHTGEFEGLSSLLSYSMNLTRFVLTHGAETNMQ